MGICLFIEWDIEQTIQYGNGFDWKWGFLKMGDPKTTVVSILKWSSMTWMIWGTPTDWKPPNKII